MSTHAPTSPAEKQSTSMAPPSGHGVTLHAAFAGVRRVPAGACARGPPASAAAGRVPEPINEPINSYAPGTPQRAELKARLKSMAAEEGDNPVIIGGRPR